MGHIDKQVLVALGTCRSTNLGRKKNRHHLGNRSEAGVIVFVVNLVQVSIVDAEPVFFHDQNYWRRPGAL